MSEMSRRVPLLLRGALRGAVAGVLSVAAMTAGEKLEQSLTRRPNSYVPGRALLTLVGRHAPDRAEPLVANHCSTGPRGRPWVPCVACGRWSACVVLGPASRTRWCA